MAASGVKRLAEAWSQAQLAYEAGEITENQWKAIFAVHRLADRDEPDLLWQFVLEVLRTSPPVQVQEILAAGPLEDLIQDFGSEMIDRIASEAAVNSIFASLLPRVWIPRADDPVTQRYIELGCDIVAV
jgi:hypothetical protein